MASGTIFSKMHGVVMTKTAKIIVTASGTIFSKMHGVGMTK